MTESPDLVRLIRLCGTATPDPPRRALSAGPLTAEFQFGGLRYIRLGGIEVVRGIMFLVRDEDWGTLDPKIEDIDLRETEDGFSVTYRATCADASRSLEYEARIEARPNGSLTFSAKTTPLTDFLTNRVGFTILHPASLAGRPISVLQTDGHVEDSSFPELIDPVQPFTNIRAVTHEIAPGVRATCRMEPDAFEMEDQRNWSDASFKTYVRPLSLPWPYMLPKGEIFTQTISLSFNATVPPRAGSRELLTVEIGREARHVVPSIGVGVPASEAGHSLNALEFLPALKPQRLVCGIDTRDAKSLAAISSFRRLAEAAGAAIALEVVISGKRDPAAELAPLSLAARQHGIDPEAITVLPAPYLMSIFPGTKGPDVVPPEAIFAATRGAFPKAKVGGGMLTYFTEFNRTRPAPLPYDFYIHATSPMVHAPDDGSVMETLETLPQIFRSARAIIGPDAAYWIGPSSIGCRTNPYGSGLVANPDCDRVCLSTPDPRQRGLFAAAWTIGYFAACARSGIEAVSVDALTGPLGLIYRPLDFAQPGYDRNGAARLYPAFHAVAGLARGAGKRILDSKVSEAGIVEAVGWSAGSTTTLWLANLSAAPQSVRLDGVGFGARVSVIDASTFESAVAKTEAVDALERALETSLTLDAYAVARVTFPV